MSIAEKKQIIVPSALNPDLSEASITHVLFIDDVVGLGDKQILVNAEHFDMIEFKDDVAAFVLNWTSFSEAVSAHAEKFLADQNYDEFDHTKMMEGMLEHDFSAFDKMKLLYVDGEGLTGSYVIDLSDESKTVVEHEFINQKLIIKLKRVK